MSALLLLSALALAADPFAACDAALPAQPEGRDAYRCYYMAARRTGDYPRAIDRVGHLAKERPTSGWARLTYANLLSDQFDPACRAPYREALDLLTAAGDTSGEVYTSLSLAKFLNDQGEVAERDELLARAVAVAERSGDRALWSAAQLQKARFWVNDGARLGEAERALLEVEPYVFPDGEYQQKIVLVNTSKNLYFATARREEGTKQLLALAALTEAQGDTFVHAAATAHLAELVVNDPLGTASIHGGDPEGYVRGALDVARRSANPAAEIATLSYAARLEPDPTAADASLAEALRIAESSEDPMYVTDALLAWAELLVDRDPARAVALADRTEALARDFDLLNDASAAAWTRGEALWALGDHDGAAASIDLAFARFEQLRDSNGEDTSKARYASGGAWWYQEEAGRWFGRSGGQDRAWGVTERMRAVSVRAALEREASGRRVAAAAQGRLLEIDRAITAERDRLWEDGLPEAERDAAVTRLEALRADRGALLEQEGVREAAPTAPIPLADVQAALEDGEVILSFLIPDAHETREPSRVIRVTRAGADVFELPGGLARRIDVFLGLLPARDGAEAEPAAALYADLLAEALSGVPDGARIVVIPDGPLHRLPLGLLRATAEGPPLAARYELATAPSASVWHRWRTRPVGPIAGWAVIADPALAAEAGLPRLPRARVEADRLVSGWPGALRLEGADATEPALRAGVAAHGGLHVAAHAVTDEVYPDRSAILLAAGEADDGRLTAAEIARLPLEDHVVVLSACRSAGGHISGGEGPLGLSRAFFRAGARTVIGSLWPLRDDDAQALFEAFARHLADGLPAGRALAEAQRERIAAGAPAEAWAGVVLLGDASVTAPGRAGLPAGWWAVGALAVGAVGALGWKRRRQPA